MRWDTFFTPEIQHCKPQKSQNGDLEDDNDCPFQRRDFQRFSGAMLVFRVSNHRIFVCVLVNLVIGSNDCFLSPATSAPCILSVYLYMNLLKVY